MFRFVINPPVFFGSVAIAVFFVATGAFLPDEAEAIFTLLQGWILATFGWLYLLAVAIFMLSVLLIATSRFGSLRLGPDDSSPDFRYVSWVAMLFAAGMGIGLLFFSVAEPISHFAIEAPPATTADEGTAGAAREAMNVTFFHWGLHAWAIYIIVGLALCYFAYRKGLPLTVRSAFYPILGDRIRGPIGDAIDTLAIVGTLFGVATSLGLGVVQINAGLDYTAGVEPSRLVQLALIMVITAVATISVILGLDRGIKRLSEGNLILSGGLVGFLLIVGPTIFIIRAFFIHIIALVNYGAAFLFYYVQGIGVEFGGIRFEMNYRTRLQYLVINIEKFWRCETV
jgi:choline/glycine/proline betaine transport protein